MRVLFCGLVIVLAYLCEDISCIHTSKLSTRVTKLVDGSSLNPDYIKLWIFFTDKGYSDIYLPKQQLHPKAIWRRRVRGIGEFGFSDVPVNDVYVAEVVATGVRHCGTSKWLNAISVELSERNTQLQRLQALPFVKSIDVVATFIHHNVGESPSPNQMRSLLENGINYGGSYEQLQQINVVAAHEQGLNGTGVTIMVADTGFLKTHPALLNARIISEHDFVNNDTDASDDGGEVHGTAAFSNVGAWAPGNLIGSAFGAHFLLAKTEDIRKESITEEDNFIQALEWGERLGADVVSASLGYLNGYCKLVDKYNM